MSCSADEMNLRKKKSFQVATSKQDDEKPATITKTNISLFKGLFYGGLSGVFFAFSALLVKYINNLPTEQLTLLRFMGIFFLSLPQAARFRGNIFGPKQHRLLIFTRSIIGTTFIFFSYITFRLLPVGEASVIILSSPAIVAILAKLFLKEPCGVFQGFILILTIIGICFIAKLPAILEGNTIVYSKETIYGILSGIGAVLLNSCQILIVRRLKEVNYIVMMFNLGWIAITIAAIEIAITGHFKWPECGIQGWLIILLALFNFISQVLITKALQADLAAPVSIMRSSVDIIVSFIFQILFFKDIPDKYGIIGATLLAISFLLSGIKKWASSLTLDSPKFKYLKILLN